MPSFVQSERRMRLTTPLGPDKLLVVAARGVEAISRLFHFELDLVTEETNIAFDKLLGQRVTLKWQVGEEGAARYVNGIVSRFVQCGRAMTFTRYRMEVVPRLWLLTRKAQSRTFQHLTVPEILKKVFGGLDASYELVGDFKQRDYCVQYRETDFQFASRLMEEEGLFYFFKHEENSHKLVVANSLQAHPELDHVIYDELAGGTREEDRIWHWEKAQQLRSGKCTLWDHCFELPGKNLEATKTTLDSVQLGPATHKLNVANDALELYDYPGGYAQRFDGVDKSGTAQGQNLDGIFEDNQRTVDIRMQAETAEALTITGKGGCVNFSAGFKFALDRHFSDGGQYVLTSVEHECRQPVGADNDPVDAFTYENRFSTIPFSIPFRPARVTPLPVVRGSQTATVVGPSGEEIFTDKYGRVKVQFHWDREGQQDADSSCWVRVATLWAGRQWGMIHIPRVGQEVVVDFLEGDPDRPIIVGSVYNADQIPPYPLPEAKTQSGIKSRSSKGGWHDNFNEIRLEDLKGQEQIFVHAEKDLLTEVEHDETRDVGNDRTTNIHHDETKTVDHDQTLTVKGNRTSTIQGDDTEKVNGKQTVQTGANQEVTVGAQLKVTVTASENHTVGASRSTSIATSDSLTAGSGVSITSGASVTITAGAGVTITSAAPLTITAPMISLSTAMLQVAGVVQCTSVISPTYTPGAGNMV